MGRAILKEQEASTRERSGPRQSPGRLNSYVRYLLVGGFVGVVSVAGRELIGALLPADTPFYYGISVIVVYGLCILISFMLHQVFTFRGAHVAIRSRNLIRFVQIAVLSAGFTGIVAVILRYAPGFERIFAPHGAMAAFVAAAILVSAISFSLNEKYVFSNRNHSEP